MMTHRSFLGGGTSLFGTAFLPTAVCAAEGDWKSAFRSVGFDPDASDASWFAVTSDIHADCVAEYMRPYMERKGTWTANAVVLHCHIMRKRRCELLNGADALRQVKGMQE